MNKNIGENIIEEKVIMVCSNNECSNIVTLNNVSININIESSYSNLDIDSIFYDKNCFYIKCPICGDGMFRCDTELANAISTFNKKNYITEFCCSSGNHYNASDIPYILFHYNDISTNNKIIKEFHRILSEIDKEDIITLKTNIFNTDNNGLIYDDRIELSITNEYMNCLFPKCDKDINKEKAEDLRLKWLFLVEELANRVNILELNKGE